MKRLAGRCVPFACALAAFLSVSTERPQSQTKPNIVLIMVDELNVGMLDTMVSKGLMPNLKAHLVDTGYAFTESFVTRALGVPSRVTSLTGQYAHNHGVLGHANETIGGIIRFNASSTVATWLRSAGYRTGYVGKYLSGYGTWTAPTYVPPGWESWTATLEPNYHSMDLYKINHNGAVIDFAPINQATGGVYYQTDVLTAQAGNFIRTAPSFLRPFFLYVAPPAVNMEYPWYNECADASAPLWGGNFWGATGRPAARHRDTIFGNTVDFALPMRPSFNEEDVSDKPDWVQRNPLLTPTDIDCLQKNYWRRLEMLRSVDEMVGYIVQSLQSTGALANTLIIFTSDNGLYYGEHRLGEKSSAYDEAIRVPLYIRAPWTSTPRQVDKLVLNNDLAPTIAHLAGAVPTITIDGRSLVPLLQNPDTSQWRRIFLIENWNEVDHPSTTAPDLFAVRTDRATPRLFVNYPGAVTGASTELYDLATDPYQLQNISADPARAQEAARLQLWLGALRTCRGLGCAVIESLFSFQ